ncbi:hypothetical protein ACS0TY_015416 [Phlomoides rotata]
MHDKLKELFGYEHDLTNEIIQISSDDNVLCEPNNAMVPIKVDDLDEEQEVESPGIGSLTVFMGVSHRFVMG